jgi:hypothetical protein
VTERTGSVRDRSRWGDRRPAGMHLLQRRFFLPVRLRHTQHHMARGGQARDDRRLWAGSLGLAREALAGQSCGSRRGGGTGHCKRWITAYHCRRAALVSALIQRGERMSPSSVIIQGCPSSAFMASAAAASASRSIGNSCPLRKGCPAVAKPHGQLGTLLEIGSRHALAHVCCGSACAYRRPAAIIRRFGYGFDSTGSRLSGAERCGSPLPRPGASLASTLPIRLHANQTVRYPKIQSWKA